MKSSSSTRSRPGRLAEWLQSSSAEVWVKFLLALLGLGLAFATALFSTVSRDAGNLWATVILASTSLVLATLVGLVTVPYLARRVAVERHPIQLFQCLVSLAQVRQNASIQGLSPAEGAFFQMGWARGQQVVKTAVGFFGRTGIPIEDGQPDFDPKHGVAIVGKILEHPFQSRASHILISCFGIELVGQIEFGGAGSEEDLHFARLYIAGR